MLKKILPAIVIFLASATASAQMRAGATYPYAYGKVLDGVLLSAAESARTAEFSLGTVNNVSRGSNFGKIRVEVNYSYGGAGITALTVTPWCQLAIDGTYARYISRSVSAGTGKVSPYVDSYTVAGASAILMLEYDIRGCYKFKVVVDATGVPDAADAVTVVATAIAGQ